MMFGRIEDDSLTINTSASNTCLCHRNDFQNGVNTFSKMVNAVLLKRSKFRTIRFCSILPACGPNTIQIMHGEILDFQCQGLIW